MMQQAPEQAFQLAIGHHHAGQLAQAEGMYRQILAQNPRHADALHMLGVLAQQVGKHAAAVELIRRAITEFPNNAAFHSNLGVAYASNNQLAEALACQQRALALQPNYPEALTNLGLVLHRLGRSDAALEPLRRAVAMMPRQHDAHRNLADALAAVGRIDEAIEEYRKAIAIDPARSSAYNNLAVMLTRLNRIDDAVAVFRQAIAASPADPAPLKNLADVLQAAGRHGEAFTAYQSALRLEPRNAAAWCGVGHALKAAGRPDDAIAAYRKAIECAPDHSLAYANLGCALRDCGQIEEAIAALRAALKINPQSATVHSNLIITLNLLPHISPETTEAEKRQWDERFARPLAGEIRAHANDPSPERRLRIGYVSPDFREHPVGRLMLRIFEHHDRAQSEIFCYSSSLQADAFAQRIQKLADHWRPVAAMNDVQLAELIRNDRIDVLVDLAMHVIGGRIVALARKPAPVQISYLAYPDGTGVSTFDYRLTDPYLDPPAAGDGEPACERPLRMPETYWCYAPAIETPAVNVLPALAARHVTFGSLNDFCKVTNEALALWARLLERLPAARLILHVPAGSSRQRVAEFFQSRGIDLARLEFPVHRPMPEYFAAYQGIDIALAPFPYGGGTTMCDALWMGVPVVSLAGASSISRAGLSVLSNVGLPELVADSPEKYVEIAERLAGDLRALAELRRGLRQRLVQSPLGDAGRFARNLEAAYRTAWRAWCRGRERRT